LPRPYLGANLSVRLRGQRGLWWLIPPEPSLIFFTSRDVISHDSMSRDPTIDGP
jgi:hypothetical protein